MPTFNIPERNHDNFQAQLGQLAKICKKLNVAEPSVTLMDIQPVKRISSIGFEWTENVYEYRVEGITPKLDGWSFKAKLENAEDGTLITTVPGFELPVEYRTRCICDHCNTKRNRNRYFFIQNEEKGLMQVGSSCIKDFLGHKNPETVAAWFEYIHSIILNEDYEEGMGPMNRGPMLYSFPVVFRTLRDEITGKGFVSRRSLEERGEVEFSGTTGNIVSSMLNDMYFPTPYTKRIEFPVLTEADTALEEHFMKYWEEKGQKSSSDFVFNVVETLSAGIGISARKMGIMAAAVNMWIKDTQTTESKVAFVPAVFFGKEKDKLVNQRVRFIRETRWTGDYGTTYVYTFRDDKHEFVWKASNEQKLVVDQEILLSGTVKAHKIWTDAKARDHHQTFVTRCKIGEIK